MLLSFGDIAALRDPIDWAVDVLAGVPMFPSAAYWNGMAGYLDLRNMLRAFPRFHKVTEVRGALAARVLDFLGCRTSGNWHWLSEGGTLTIPGLLSGFLGPTCALALHEKGFGASLLSDDLLRQVSQPVGRKNR
jgi:hypothetical protein